MRKAELVQRIAEELGCTQGQAEAAVAAILTTIKEALRDGEPVFLRRFGTWQVRAKRARSVATPRRGPWPRLRPGGSSGSRPENPSSRSLREPCPYNQAATGAHQGRGRSPRPHHSTRRAATTEGALSFPPARPVTTPPPRSAGLAVLRTTAATMPRAHGGSHGGAAEERSWRGARSQSAHVHARQDLRAWLRRSA